MQTNKNVKKLRTHSIEAEKRLWYFLRDRGVENCKFRRQHSIGRYIADFCCIEKKLVIELDGGHHLLNKDYDERRARFLQSKGYCVIRFWDNEVMTKTEVVLEEIQKQLMDPHPGPLPLGEGK